MATQRTTRMPTIGGVPQALRSFWLLLLLLPLLMVQLSYSYDSTPAQCAAVLAFPSPLVVARRPGNPQSRKTEFLVVSLSSSTASTRMSHTDSIAAASSKSSNGGLSSPNSQALVDIGPFPRTWIPLASVFELDGSRPNAVYFLGQEYVVYCQTTTTGTKNSTTTTTNHGWVVTDGACPHRLAPLAEGRIDPVSQHLECSYHGWTFDGATGNCVTIPQLEPEQQQSVGAGCRLTTYTCVVEKNILWAWLWPCDALAVTAKQQPAAAAAALATTPEHFLQNVPDLCSTYTRDLPYSWDTLLENIVDPSHVPFAHHGLQGKRIDAIPVQMSLAKNVSAQGFSFDFADRTMGMKRKGAGIFRAPFVIQYGAVYESPAAANVTTSRRGLRRRKNDKTLTSSTASSVPKTSTPSQAKTFNLTTILIPTKPGWSRIIIFGSPTTKRQKQLQDNQKKRLSSRIIQCIPTWLLHQLSNLFLDSDLVFLHSQERERLRRQHVTSTTNTSFPGSRSFGYFMPSQADRCVVALRNWVEDYAHVLGPLPPLETNRKVLFDRWYQHSDQCRHCHEAAINLVKWRNRTYWTVAISLLFIRRYIVARIAAVGCLALFRFYNWVDSTLKHGEFQHYKNH